MSWSPVEQPIRVVLADDQELILTGFSLILEAESDVLVVGTARNGEEAIALVADHAPDVALLDIRMPEGLDGIEATRRIVERHPATRVIVLTTFDSDRNAYAALRAGASGFVSKTVAPAELVAAIRTVAAGDAVLSPRLTRRLLDLFAPHLPEAGDAPGDRGVPPRLRALSSRELDVFRELARGASNAEIAARLFLSEATVKSHVSGILTKLGVRDRVHAVIVAYEVGFLAR